MNLLRIINIYIVLMGICIFFIIIGIRVLKRNREDRINQCFSAFFFTTAIGLIINFIYALITNPEFQALVNFLNTFTIFLICFGLAFLLLAVILLDPKKEVSSKSQLLIIILYGLVSSILFFIPDKVEVKITSNGEQLSPVWSLPFVSVALGILITSFILTSYYAINLYKRFNSSILRRKLKFFIMGISTFYYIGIMVCLSNYSGTHFLRLLFSISGIVAIPGGLLIYYGIYLAPKPIKDLPVKESKKRKINLIGVEHS